MEEVSADWTKSDPMGGPKSRPDFAAGIHSSAFPDEEISKLKNHTAWERATLFADNMYFPFLLCEAKNGDQGINRADRQNAQSSSVAVNAVLQLHRVLGDDRASQLSGQILVFSVSHDNERVKVYGHYTVIEGAKATFYRSPVESFTLNFRNGQGRKRTYDFVRELYRKFYPEHLKRIREALAEMDNPRAQSMTSNMSVEESESQELDPSAPPSQETLNFKRPNAPASKRQKGEIAILREQLAQQERQSQEQMALLERQMAQQEKQYKEQISQQEKQMAQQIEMLKQLLDRQ
jgi:flagellar biosynthesis GTPase FlhF